MKKVASIYKNDPALFEKTAREWTRKHANGKVDPEYGLDKEAIKRLSEMGFDRSAVVDALRKSLGNEETALELILSSL